MVQRFWQFTVLYDTLPKSNKSSTAIHGITLLLREIEEAHFRLTEVAAETRFLCFASRDRC